jgi:hypothetical protein
MNVDGGAGRRDISDLYPAAHPDLDLTLLPGERLVEVASSQVSICFATRKK